MGSQKLSRFGVQFLLTVMLLLLVPVALADSGHAPCGDLAPSDTLDKEMAILTSQVVLTDSMDIPAGTLDPPGPIDYGTANVEFQVQPGDFASGTLVDKVTLSVGFSKLGSGTNCPGPSGGDDWAEEVRIRLYAPDDTRVALVKYGDYNWSNPDVGPVTVVFDDDAASSVANKKIQSGTFKPSSGELADFRGLDPAADGGVWTLELSDQYQGDPICFITATLHIETRVPPDLSVATDDTPDPVHPGESLLYDVTVHNAGPVTALSLVVTDTLPAALTYVSDSGGCSLGSGPGGADQLVCTLDTLAPAADHAFQVLTRLAPDFMTSSGLTGTIFMTNTVEAVSDLPNSGLDDTLWVESTFVTDLADLRVTKLSQPMTTLRAGESFTYTIFVDNFGPSFARNVVLTDTILSDGAFTLLDIVDDPDRPDSCAVVDAAGGKLITCDPGEPLDVWGYGTGDGRWEIQLAVRALEAQSVSGVVEVRSLDPDGASGLGISTADPDLSNNQALTFLSVTSVADLAVSETAMGQVQVVGQPRGTFVPVCDQVTVGGLLTYTLAVTNSGPSAALNTTVEDLLPASVVLEQVDASRGVCHWGTPGDPADPLSCNLGALALGDSAVITVTVQAPADMPASGSLHSEVWVASETYDPDNLNNLTVKHVAVDLGLQRVFLPVVLRSVRASDSGVQGMPTFDWMGGRLRSKRR